MAVTQQQIAERLGVTKGLVGKALNGHPLVAAATRQRVEEVARELGYTSHSNPAARALAARRHGSRVRAGAVAVLYARQFGGQPLRNLPYFVQFFDAIEAECERRGLDAIFMPFRAQGLQRIVREGLVDGALFLSYDPSLVLFEQLKVPFVLLGHHAQNVCSIRPDGKRGISELVRHLAGLGHRDIGYLGHRADHLITGARVAGYREGLAEMQLTYQPNWVEASLMSQSAESVASALGALWERTGGQLTALVCYNDTIAMHAISWLQERGVNVPANVSVTGFDDISVASGFPLAVTSVGFDRNRVALRGLEILDAQVEAGPDACGAALNEVVTVQLAARDSTGPVAPQSASGIRVP